MIANITSGSDFAGAIGYVLGKLGAQRLLSNVPEFYSSDRELANSFCEVADRNYRVRKPVYHVSLSPSVGDNLSIASWISLASDFLRERGLLDRQFIAVLHRDATYPDGTERPHLHLIINKVDFLGKVAETWMDFPKTEKILRHLERCYDLQSVPCSWEVERRRDTSCQVQRMGREQQEYEEDPPLRNAPPVKSVRSQLQAEIEEVLPKANSLAGFCEMLSANAVSTVVVGSGVKFEKDGVWFAGYQLGRGYTFLSLQRRLEQQNLVRTIGPIVEKALGNGKHLVGQHHTAYRDGERLILTDSFGSLKMQAVCQDGRWELSGPIAPHRCRFTALFGLRSFASASCGRRTRSSPTEGKKGALARDRS